MKKSVSRFVLFLTLCSLIVSLPKINIAEAEPKTIVVPDDYLTIGWAIGNASEGDTIFVKKGTYYEHVTINKSISLIGENRSTTVIDGNGTGNVVTITAGNVSISGFTIQHGGFDQSCIYISSSSGVTINDNVISNNFEGIRLNSSNGNYIADNLISPYAAVGIFLEYSNGNVISGNIINPEIGLDQIGILLTYSKENSIINNTILNNVYDGIRLIWSADNNIITGNTISNNDYGIHAIYSNSNTISNNMIVENANGIFIGGGNEKNTVVGNTLSDNWAAISFSYSSYDNIICHNNFINNTHQIGNPIHSDPLSSNRWDNGLEGNYWSDYTGKDANFDGIGDTPYIADGDNYPLMGMFYDFRFWDVNIVISNSTIRQFTAGYHMNSTTGTWEKCIMFHVLGTEGTVGFCRVMIPREFMESPYTVLVNNEKVNATELSASNNTHVFLYFTYTHSGIVTIIPEFPTWTSTLLLLVVLTVALTIYKRRLPKTPTQ